MYLLGRWRTPSCAAAAFLQFERRLQISWLTYLLTYLYSGCVKQANGDFAPNALIMPLAPSKQRLTENA